MKNTKQAVRMRGTVRETCFVAHRRPRAQTATCLRIYEAVCVSLTRCPSDADPVQSRRVTNRRSDHPGPRSRRAAALSSVAESPGYIVLRAREARPSGMRSTRMGRPATAARAAPSPTDVPDPAARRSGRTCREDGLRERKQAPHPAAIGSRADMAYSIAS